MNQVLLLGAGFSKNWNGWLATEVMEYLLGTREVRGNEFIRELLVQHAAIGGFEVALEQLQLLERQAPSTYSGNLASLQAAVGRMFDDMNSGYFERLGFEFQNHEPQVRTFLTRFDAIFTLNQDVLLEHFYKDQFDVSLSRGRRWDGIQIPGMKRIKPSEPIYDASWARATWVTLPDSDYRIEPRCQPLIKIHGSSNWRSAEGGTLMVIGGEKESQIRVHSVLARNADEFESRLMAGDTRLMVIGYGFRDRHITDVITRAVRNRGLRFFIVDSDGAGLARKLNPTSRASIYAKSELEGIFELGLIGASSRPLSNAFGGDTAEYRKLEQFFS
jgi:hypothetical protein